MYGYLYSAMWLIIAAYLVYAAFKYHKFLLVLSGFFLYLSGWYLADELLTDVNLFEGTYLIIFRCVAVAVLILCAIVYLLHKRALRQATDQSNND